MSRRVKLLSDANLGDVRQPAGKVFAVVGKPVDKLKAAEVDTGTADLWERFGWAEPFDGKASTAGDDAG